MPDRCTRIGVLCALLALAVPACDRTAPVTVGSAAPAFTLERLSSGTTQFPADGREKVVVIHFWLSSCDYCRDEMRAIDALQRRIGADRFLALSVSAGDQRAAAEHYVRGLDLSYPVLLDPAGDTARRYGVTAVPFTVIVDRDGMVRHRIFGEVTREILEQMTAQLIGAH